MYLGNEMETEIAYREIEVRNNESIFQFHNSHPGLILYITTNNRQGEKAFTIHWKKFHAGSHQDKLL